MKKIIFVTNKLIIGGIETALLETIRLIQSTNVEITVLSLNEGGELVESFKEICSVKHLSTSEFDKAFLPKYYLTNQLKKFKLFSFIKGVCAKIFNKYFRSVYMSEKKISQKLPKDPAIYDVAVSYFSPYFPTVPYVANEINAKKKYAWIHHDVLFDSFDKDVSDFTECYQKFDKIVCVSNTAKKSFIKRHPPLSDKVEVIYNPIDVNKIINLSNEEISIVKDSDCINICSVGRLSPDKQLNLAIYACDLLKKRGYSLKWYICGDGIHREYLQKLITDNALENNVFLMGNQSNPYKYMAISDIYVQTSKFESYCITLAEARALKKPIVTTDFPCAYEHITDGYNGFVCEMNPEKIANAIEKLINSPELREKFSNNTTQADNDNLKLKEIFE